jgi:ATP-dependent Clp protease adaptor protein ClpS
MRAKVMLLNDERTMMEFVVDVLQHFFGKTHDEALMLMLEIHRDGSGVCGVYDPVQAWTLAEHVVALARQSGQPLRCVIEPDA